MGVTVPIARKLFNVAEYYRMAEAGILHEDDRVELIEGEIVEMSPIGRRHQACVDRLDRLFNRACGPEVQVRTQGPIRLNDLSEPEPDLTLLKLRADFYASGHPGPQDVLLVVEVSETSGVYDRDVKVPLYARTGIPEVWLVRLMDDAIRVHRHPEKGVYQEVHEIRRGDTLSPQALPDIRLPVDDILG